MYDVLVLGGTAVTPTATEALDLAVEGERIVAIDRPGALGAEARKVIDASGCLVLPGGIDPHVHYGVDFQGLFVTEGQEHSAASALGGTTTICDFVFEVLGTELPFPQAGQAAVELRLPVLYSKGVQEGRLSLERFVELVAANPVKLMGLWPQKERLAVGADADVVVLDPERRWTVRWEDLHMDAGYSCWDGWELRGKVRDTILRGSVIVEGERFVGSRSGGRFVQRTLLPEVLARPLDPSLTLEPARTAA